MLLRCFGLWLQQAIAAEGVACDGSWVAVGTFPDLRGIVVDNCVADIWLAGWAGPGRLPHAEPLEALDLLDGMVRARGGACGDRKRQLSCTRRPALGLDSGLECTGVLATLAVPVGDFFAAMAGNGVDGGRPSAHVSERLAAAAVTEPTSVDLTSLRWTLEVSRSVGNQVVAEGSLRWTGGKSILVADGDLPSFLTTLHRCLLEEAPRQVPAFFAPARPPNPPSPPR